MLFRPIRSIAAAATLTLPAVAHGQAFVRDRGETRIITTVLTSSSDRIFGDDGRSQRSAGYDKTEVYVQAEYGLTDDLTVLVTPSFRDVHVGGERGSTGLGYTEVGARYRLASHGSAIVSLQGTVRIPGETRQSSLAQIGQTNVEYDVRAQGGIGFGRDNFAIVEAGYRFRTGDPADDFHLDGTLGLRAAPRLWVIANSFNTFSNGSGRGVFRTSRYSNLYLSAAYEVSRRITLQAGVYGTWAGRNALRERGLLASVWFHL